MQVKLFDSRCGVEIRCLHCPFTVCALLWSILPLPPSRGTRCRHWPSRSISLPHPHPSLRVCCCPRRRSRLLFASILAIPPPPFVPPRSRLVGSVAASSPVVGSGPLSAARLASASIPSSVGWFPRAATDEPKGEGAQTTPAEQYQTGTSGLTSNRQCCSQLTRGTGEG
jgi:hypothetical protein